MTRLADARVVIVGLGLMGGSLSGALRGRCARVTGVARREETIESALSRGLIDDGTTDLVSVVDGAKIVVLATPVRTIMRQIEEIGPLLSPGCLLMDIGSTKAQIAKQMEHLPASVEPLGGHPMCGREVAGIAAAEATLYRGCTFILTPLARTSPDALALGESLVQAVGAHPLVLKPNQQDRLAATISHLPYLLACALVNTADVLT
ncbi:MAG TPA: prephenate dehydrogenase, partial [Candidatus Acetothermia bacterium]|nr:prephenate dehydrogenase [Candidatus Acetothermia bacterium]